MCDDIQKMNFLELLNKEKDKHGYTVEIPMLQRDYAQGRDDSKTKELRTNFIKNLVSATKELPLHLDFIYGPVENGTFRPLDGQQRLTTLFLLHWYIAVKSNDDDLFKILKKFKYKVRVTTQEFLDAILTKKNVEKEALALTKTNLKDAKWYYSTWDFDPTVQGMLNTIETINVTIKDNVPKKIHATFHLLIMDKFNLGDELYMRMNARGLALTDFENFKSWLEAHCGKYSDDKYFNKNDSAKNKKKNWTYKIDNEWTNLLWALSDKDKTEEKNSFDEMFMRFFRGMAQFSIANTDDAKSSEKKESKNLITTFSDSTKFISLKQYEKCFNNNILDDCFNNLDFVCNKDNSKHLVGFYFEQDRNIFSGFLKEQTYEDKILFYSLIQYLKKNNWEIKNIDNLARFKRIIRNLVQNTVISNENFIDAIQSINDLAEKSDSLLENIKNNKIKLKTFTEQIKEEKLKAELIINNSSWEDEFIKYENHPYFYGQIAFILEMSKIDDNYNIDNFNKYAEKLQKLFCDNIIENNNWLLSRALLTIGNYLFDFRHNEEIPNKKDSKNKNSLWRNIFKNETRRKILKNFVDSFNNYNINVETIKAKIEDAKKCNFDYKWCGKLLVMDKIPYKLISNVTKEYIIFHNCRGGNYYSCIYPERDEFYNDINNNIPEEYKKVIVIEPGNKYSKIKLKKSINNTDVFICLEKSTDKENIIIGILKTNDEKLNKLLLDNIELNKYNHKPSFWLCDRYEDSWEENKNNTQRYADELLEIYEKIEKIGSVN